MDEKMKKMGDMQLSAVTDTKKRKTILDQVGVILLSSLSSCQAGVQGENISEQGMEKRLTAILFLITNPLSIKIDYFKRKQ